MSKIKIIGHRGAAGLAPENTVAAIKKAIELQVDGIEFDLRATKDRRLILCHDDNLEHTCGISVKIRDLTLYQIREIPTLSGEPIATFEDALMAAQEIPLMVEPKEPDIAGEIVNSLRRFPNAAITFTSFEHEALKGLSELGSQLPQFPTDTMAAPGIVRIAASMNAQGISINYRVLNPLTYWRARRKKLQVMIFTLDKPWLLKIYKVIYPSLMVCTNRPDLLLPVVRRGWRITR